MAGRTPGYALNDAGRGEAARLAAGLVGLPIAGVYCSPVQRAMETAGFVAARLGLTPVVEPGLDEIDLGSWCGASFAALDGAPGWREFNVFRALAPVPGGEGILAVQARAVGVLQRLAAARDGLEVALVSHADIVKVLLAAALGMPLDLMRRLEVAPASRSVLALHGDDAVVEAMNLPA